MYRAEVLENFYMTKEASGQVIRGIRQMAAGKQLSRSQIKALTRKGFSTNMSPEAALKKLDSMSDVNSPWFQSILKRNNYLHPGNRFNPRSRSAGFRLDEKIDSMRRQPRGTHTYDQKEYVMKLVNRRRQKATNWNYDLKDTELNPVQRSYVKIRGKKTFID